jgi:hypothetical protein
MAEEEHYQLRLSAQTKMALAVAPTIARPVTVHELTALQRARRERFFPELQSLIGGAEIATIDLCASATRCEEACARQIERWRSWLAEYFVGTYPATAFVDELGPRLTTIEPLCRYRVPAIALALLSIPPNHDGYLRRIGTKPRNMLRKVERKGYRFRTFAWHDHLDEIYAINTSKPMRGGMAMTPEYQTFPPRLKPEPIRGCTAHNFDCCGCFYGEQLVAYCAIHFCGELGIVRNNLGHAAHLPDGIMNGIIAYAVRICVDRGTVKYMNYLTLHSRTRSLDGFKRRVGFKPKAVLIHWPWSADR